MSDDEKLKVSKMFNILSYECFNVLAKLNKLEDDKIELDVGDYIKINDLNELSSNMKNCCYITCKKDKAYGVAISLLISSTDKIREVGNYNNNINISMNEGFINMFDSELLS